MKNKHDKWIQRNSEKVFETDNDLKVMKVEINKTFDEISTNLSNQIHEFTNKLNEMRNNKLDQFILKTLLARAKTKQHINHFDGRHKPRFAKRYQNILIEQHDCGGGLYKWKVFQNGKLLNQMINW